MEVKVAEPSLLPIADISVQQGTEQKTAGKNFKQIYGELFGTDQLEATEQKDVEAKLNAKDALTKLKAEKDKDKKKISVDPSLMLASLMIRNLDELTRSREVLALNNKNLIADLKSAVNQLRESAALGGNGKNTSVPTGSGTAPGQSDSQVQLDPKMLQKIKDLANKYPVIADKLNNVIAKTTTDMSALVKTMQQTDLKAAEIHPQNLKPVMDALKLDKPVDNKPVAEGDVVRQEKKAVVGTPVVMFKPRKSDLADSDLPGLKKLAIAQDDKPADAKVPFNLMAVSSGQNNLSLRVSSASNADAGKFRQNILDQVEGAVKLQVNSAQNEVRIKLNPPSLGEIIIKLQMMEDKAQPGKQIIVSNMIVENESVKDALMSGVAQLKQRMQETSGVNLKDFNVMVKTNQEFNPQQRQNDTSRTSKKKGFTGGFEEDEQDQSLSQVMMDLDGIFDYVA